MWELAQLRIRLLLRQKIFWVSLGLTLFIAILSFLFGNISFIRPEKIFWDFSLAGLFALQIFLASFLGSFLFSEERERRTLHWILSFNVSRGQWILGNFLGLSVVLLIVSLAASVVFLPLGFGYYSAGPNPGLVLQTITLCFVESLVVLALALLISFFVRPILAFSFVLILVFFLHSQDSLRRILLDPVSGRFVENWGLEFLLYLSRFLPPLQWMNLRDLVGYEASLPWGAFLGIFASGLLWMLILVLFSKHRFERLDL